MADASGSDIELDNSDVEAELLVSPNPASIPSSVPTAEGTQTTVTNLDDSQALAEVPEGSDAPVLQQEIDVVPNAATLAEIRPNEPNPDAAEVQTALNDVSHVDAAPTLPAAVTAAPDAAPQSIVPKPVIQQQPPLNTSQSSATSNSPVPPRLQVPLPPKPVAAISGINQSKTATLRQRIEGNPIDSDAWLTLITDAETKGDLDKTREVYEEFFKVYPESGKHWVAYADLELRHSLFQRVEAIFGRCLRNSTSVELWNFYLTYIRRMNKLEGVDAEKAKHSRTVISKAYEFCLTHIGNDRDGGQIWSDYITFLRSLVAAGTWEEQQNMDSIRKTYQKAVTLPLANVEQIWSEYNHWEQNLNKLTAKKFIAGCSAPYMTARTALREMKPLTDNLFPTTLPHKPDWHKVSDRQLIENWRKYLKWEESNPLQYEDVTILHARVLYAYRRAFTILRFYPEIWYTASNYARSVGKLDDAIKYLENGRAANSLSLMVSFAYAEIQESRKAFEECYQIYDSLIGQYSVLLEKATTERDDDISRAVSETQASTSNGDTKMEENEDDGTQKTLAGEIAQIRENITKKAAPRIDSLKRALANVWITEMRFARRAEGIKQARTVFGKARKTAYLTWQTVYANAMMEYHWNKEPKVATNVFELGLKVFGEDIDYVVRYLDFLIQTNDDSNARAVFERTITKIKPEQARPLWEKWAQYESQYGDLAAIEKLDARISEAYPAVPAIFRFAERHVHSGLTELLTEDLGLLPTGGIGSVKRGRSPSSSRSPSPPLPRTNKRGPSEERYQRRSPSPRRDRDRDSGKRQRRDSPSPSRRGYGGSDRRPLSPPFMRDRHYQPPPPPAVLNNRPPPPSAIVPPPRPYGEIPDGVAFFMGLLPMVNLFNGPILPGHIMMDLISGMNLPRGNGGGRTPIQMGNASGPMAMGSNRYGRI